MFQDHGQSLRQGFREYLYETFIRYNPLYFLSSLSLLVGLYLLTTGLDDIGWKRGEVLVTSTTQFYELLLIAGAALLFRRARMPRPAVILGLLEVVFLFDCTSQSEVNANLDFYGILLAALWTLLTVFKLYPLAWTFRLRVPRSTLAVLVLAAAGIAWAPQVMELESIDRESVHLFMTWYLTGLTGFTLWRRPAVSCALDLDEWGQTVLRRVVGAAWVIWSALILGHLVTWLFIHDLKLTPLHSVPVLLLVAFLSNEERWVWTGSAGALLAATAEPAAVSATAMAVAAVIALQARRTGNGRFWTGCVLALHLAVWTIGWQSGPWPEAPTGWTIAMLSALLVLAWRLESPFAVLPIPLGLILLDLDTVGWGVALVAVGFLALIAGVAVNWKQRPKTWPDVPLDRSE